MKDQFSESRLEVIRLRRQLAELEEKRNAVSGSIPPAMWQELVSLSGALEKAESILSEHCTWLAGEVNLVRQGIITDLDHYNQLREQMRQVEELFLVNIVRPGNLLKNALHHRQYLEAEYQRLLKRVQQGAFANQGELEEEVQQILTSSDEYSQVQAEPDEEESIEDENLEELASKVDVETLVDAIALQELRREFKRVVLPRVHPDTSNTPAEVFKSVFEVYKKGDPLMMEAYIIQYKGELQVDREDDPLERLDELLETREAYTRLAGRLGKRLAALQKEQTEQEAKDPQKLEQDLQDRRREILARIAQEAEEILQLRAKIESLILTFRNKGNS